MATEKRIPPQSKGHNVECGCRVCGSIRKQYRTRTIEGILQINELIRQAEVARQTLHESYAPRDVEDQLAIALLELRRALHLAERLAK